VILNLLSCAPLIQPLPGALVSNIGFGTRRMHGELGKITLEWDPDEGI